MSNFDGENRLVIGAADAYEESIGDRVKRPRVVNDFRRGKEMDLMIADVSDEEIEGMAIEQLRRQMALQESLKITQENAELYRQQLEWSNRK